jgi:hypothetical protein
MRAALTRKILKIIFEITLKDCSRPVCHRRNVCQPPRGQPCQSAARNRRPATPEHEARIMALLSRALKRRLAEGPDATDEAAATLSAPRDKTPSGLPSRRRGGRS